MAYIHASSVGWHVGERTVQSLLHVPYMDNPTAPGMSPHSTRMLHLSSMLALGTLDDKGRPWTTLIGGKPGFVRSLGQSVVGVKTLVDRKFDPVVEALLGRGQDGEIKPTENAGRVMSALGIHLETRDRVKLAGKMVGGALEDVTPEDRKEESSIAEIQAVFSIKQSISNCPKYINKKRLTLSAPKPKLVSDSLPLCDSALNLIAKADMFFLSASNHGSSMSTNHRGGPPGFVRVAQNDKSGVVLMYPELSGNRFYQTLGNLYTTPKTGLIFPDFDSADALYLTGTTEILVGKDAAALLPRSNLAIKITVDAARFVQQGLAFRGQTDERSPYNPPVRYLATERTLPDAQIKDEKVAYVKLLARDMLTPTIARFRFSLSDPEVPERWKPGQYVTLAFEDELSMGYSHMRDDDPRSLNDDYVRTFTISSSPRDNLPDDEFEITIRNVGVATNFLFKQNIRAGLELPLKGFGGTFNIEPSNRIVPFVAGGIGITPLLAQLSDLDPKSLQLFWTINFHDVGLALATFERYPPLAGVTKLFLSGLDESISSDTKAHIKRLEEMGSHVTTRRLVASDVDGQQHLSSTWYLCTGPQLRKSLLGWLPGQQTVFEDFDY